MATHAGWIIVENNGCAFSTAGYALLPGETSFLPLDEPLSTNAVAP